MTPDENNAFQQRLKSADENTQRLVEPAAALEDSPSAKLVSDDNSATNSVMSPAAPAVKATAGASKGDAKIVPQGIRSRWQDDQTAKNDAAAKKQQRPVDDIKSARKRWWTIGVMCFIAVLLAMFAALKDVAGSKGIGGATAGTAIISANIAAQLGATPIAMAIYEANFKSDPRFVGILINLANSVAARDPSGAQAIYDKAVKSAPLNSSAYMNRGNNQLTLKKDKEGLNDYNEAIRLNPNYSLAFYNRAMYYRERDKYDLAVPDFNKAIETNGKFNNPKRNFFQADRGYCYLQMKRYAPAIKDFTDSIDSGRAEAYLYNNRGWCYQNLGRYKEAIKDYDQALKLDPKYVNALEGRAYSLSQIGDGR